MEIIIKVNGRRIAEQIEPDLLLIDFLRKHGCYSVKRGCETANCGLCTVLMDNTPVLSCSVLAARAMDMKFIPWKDFRRKRQSLSGLLPIRERISAVSVIRDLS